MGSGNMGKAFYMLLIQYIFRPISLSVNLISILKILLLDPLVRKCYSKENKHSSTSLVEENNVLFNDPVESIVETLTTTELCEIDKNKLVKFIDQNEDIDFLVTGRDLSNYEKCTQALNLNLALCDEWETHFWILVRNLIKFINYQLNNY